MIDSPSSCRRAPALRCTFLALLGCFVLASLMVDRSLAAEKLQVLIVDGQNNHNWQATTPLLKQALESSGKFAVDVATSPARGADMSGFQPEFAKYDVVVSNYNGDLWSETTRKNLVDYVGKGGGLVVVHAANNAFPQWPEYNDMIGLGWRGPTFGERVTLNDQGEKVVTPKGEGPGAGHGPQHPFLVIVRDHEHPITKGLPKAWMHVKDELYHGQRGPAKQMQILATAFSAPDRSGTNAHEPMLWVIPFGEGRVFTSVLGHSPESMTCVGFITTLQRGAEWAATGKVAEPSTPEDFPTPENVSTRELK